MIKREKYLKQLIDYKDINLIKIITGLRRSGKSTLLMQFKEYLLTQNIKEKNIIYMNFESAEWYDIKDYKDLYKYVESKIGKNKLYILLDEVQYVEKWEKAINSMHVDMDCDIYITGSNAYLLSSELTTLIAGRIATVKVYPFSYKELRSIYPEKSNEELLDNYIKNGGLPFITSLTNDAMIQNYLRDVKDVVLNKDVLARNSGKDLVLLENILRYVSSIVGNFVSINSITEELNKSSNSNMHHLTVDNYLKLLENAFIIYKVPRYDLNGKELLKTQGKYYLTDLGLRNIITGYNNYDSGSAYENLVYLELKRRGYEVEIGKYNNLEIDFIAKKGNKIMYYQVSRSILEEKVEEREKRSLLAIKDNYPKYIITCDKVFEKNIEGIEVKNIIDFLLESEK